MEPSTIIGITILIIIIVVIIAVINAINRVRVKLRQFSRVGFNTDSIIEGVKQQQYINSQTPKSVCGMTSVYMPQIQKDFPEFNLSEYISKTEQVLKHYFSAIQMGEFSLLNEFPMIMEQAQNEYNQNKYHGNKLVLKNTKIHRTEISNYMKSSGSCKITFQSSVEQDYVKYDNSSKLIEGDNDLKTQSVYQIVLSYIQDEDKIKESTGNKSLGLNCPNCGAPVTTLGEKICEYCGSGIVEINIHSWKYSLIKKIK